MTKPGTTSNGITLLRGQQGRPRSTASAARVVAEDGTAEPYDKLLIATGSDPFIIPVPGEDLPGVVTFRDLDDVEQMLAVAAERRPRRRHRRRPARPRSRRRARGRGMDGDRRPPDADPDGAAARSCRRLPARTGDRGRAASRSSPRPTPRRSSATEQGRLASASTTGARFPPTSSSWRSASGPATGLAKAAGLEVNRGILVDDDMRTSDPTIFAVGECVEHRGLCYGLVAPLYEMARASPPGSAARTRRPIPARSPRPSSR